jgi:hypothetical protein
MPSLNTGNAILSNAIAVDSSYNVGIGGAASGSFKLQVTGTGNFTSRLTIGDAVGSSPLVWARSGGATGYLYSDGDNVGITNVLDFGAGYEGILLNSSTSAINFYTNGVSTPRLAIASTGAATFTSNSNSTITNVFQNTNTTNTSSRNILDVIAGNVSTNIQSIHNDHSYINVTNNLYFQSGSGVKMTMLSNGRVGIGTNTPADKLNVSNGGAEGLEVGFNTNQVTMIAYNRSTSAYIPLILQGGGGVVNIGTSTNDYARVAIKSNTTTPYGGFNVYANGNGNFVFMNHDNNVGWIGTEFGAGGTGFTPLAFSVGGGQRMTILTDGKTGIGKTAQITGLDVYQSGTDVINARTDAAAGNARSLFTGWNTASATTSGNFCFNVTSNGNVTNSNNSYGPISDIKLKENIVDASPKLDDLMKVRIVNYNLKAELGYESYKQIGVIAQELEQVFPGLVDEFNDRDVNGNELGTTTKSVKMSVFVPMLIKAIQELNQKVNEQQQTINSLINR